MGYPKKHRGRRKRGSKYRRNKIIIDKHKVTLNAVQDFRCLEMNFAGSINTISLLPNNYIIHKGLNKIIIINLNQTSTVFNKSYDLDLFKYKGKTYKFTGAFAPVNQILGLVSF